MNVKKDRAIFIWPWKVVSVSFRYFFYQPMDEKITTWTLRFPTTKTLIWRRHCSIGQSCCSMKSKRSIGWFLESSRAWSFFTRAFGKPTESHARLYPFDKPIKSFYFRLFVVSVLFARFHSKVIRKSFYYLLRYVYGRVCLSFVSRQLLLCCWLICRNHVLLAFRVDCIDLMCGTISDTVVTK